MAEFDISTDRLLKVADDLVLEMESGLSGTPSSLLMLPTYVHRLPDSNMIGSYLALGWNLKYLLLISLTFLLMRKGKNE